MSKRLHDQLVHVLHGSFHVLQRAARVGAWQHLPALDVSKFCDHAQVTLAPASKLTAAFVAKWRMACAHTRTTKVEAISYFVVERVAPWTPGLLAA